MCPAPPFGPKGRMPAGRSEGRNPAGPPLAEGLSPAGRRPANEGPWTATSEQSGRRVDAALRPATTAGRRGAGVRLGEAGARVARAEEADDAARHRLALDLLHIGPVQQVGFGR